MKLTNKLLAVAILLGLVFTLGCKKDDNGPGPGTDVPGDELAGTWVQTAPEDITGPAAADFTGFSITISVNANAVTYTTNSNTNGNVTVFPPSGTFDVEESDDAMSGNGANITRNPDQVDVNAKVSADGKSLVMTFTINTAGGDAGRYAGIDGNYTFNLDKQQ